MEPKSALDSYMQISLRELFSSKKEEEEEEEEEEGRRTEFHYKELHDWYNSSNIISIII